jgi:hypothetical protein
VDVRILEKLKNMAASMPHIVNIEDYGIGTKYE